MHRFLRSQPAVDEESVGGRSTSSYATDDTADQPSTHAVTLRSVTIPSVPLMPVALVRRFVQLWLGLVVGRQRLEIGMPILEVVGENVFHLSQ